MSNEALMIVAGVLLLISPELVKIAYLAFNEKEVK